MITPKRTATLEFIRTFVAEHGYSPTFREIAAKLGIHNNAVFQQVSRLKRDGYVTFDPGKARTIRVLQVPASEFEVEFDVENYE